MRMISLGLAFAAACAALVSCAPAPTPYQPYIAHDSGGIHGGYSEQRLAADRYLVRFHGNSMTSRDRVEGYMLYRAAELTLQNGYDWFLVVDRNTQHNIRTIVEPDPFYNPWYGRAYAFWRPDWSFYSSGVWRNGSDWSGSRFWADQYGMKRIEAFEATAEIEMHKGAILDGQRTAIDARHVIADLGPTIERPKA